MLARAKGIRKNHSVSTFADVRNNHRSRGFRSSNATGASCASVGASALPTYPEIVNRTIGTVNNVIRPRRRDNSGLVSVIRAACQVWEAGTVR